MTDPMRELQRLFVILQGRVIDAGASFAAGNLEAMRDDLNELATDLDAVRDALWGVLNPEEECEP